MQQGIAPREGFVIGCGLVGTAIGYAGFDGQLMPMGALGLAGLAVGFGLLFVTRLVRIGDKALKKLERKLDDK